MFFEQLTEACKKQGKTVTAVANELKISKSNVTNWKNGTTPNGDIVVRLSELLGVTADYLLKGKNNIDLSTTLIAEEKELLNYFKELDDLDKRSVLGKAEGLAEAARRKKALKTVPQAKLKPLSISTVSEEPDDEYEYEEEYLEIPLAELPASAGTGIYLDSDYSETIKVAANEKTRQTDFAVKVSGDSMEPRFCNGDIVLVREQPVKVGETGIFVYEGEGYIKELGEDCLISLNPEYPNIQINNPDSLFCQGKVIAVLRLVKKRR